MGILRRLALASLETLDVLSYNFLMRLRHSALNNRMCPVGAICLSSLPRAGYCSGALRVRLCIGSDDPKETRSPGTTTWRLQRSSSMLSFCIEVSGETTRRVTCRLKVQPPTANCPPQKFPPPTQPSPAIPC